MCTSHPAGFTHYLFWDSTITENTPPERSLSLSIIGMYTELTVHTADALDPVFHVEKCIHFFFLLWQEYHGTVWLLEKPIPAVSTCFSTDITESESLL